MTIAVVVSVFAVVGLVQASTTISTNVNTGGTLTVSGQSTLATASSTGLTTTGGFWVNGTATTTSHDSKADGGVTNTLSPATTLDAVHDTVVEAMDDIAPGVMLQLPKRMALTVEPPLPTINEVELAVPTATKFPAVVIVPVVAVVVAVPFTQKPPVVVKPVEEAVARVDWPVTPRVLLNVAAPTTVSVPAVAKLPVDAVVVAVPLTQKPPVVVRPVEEAVARVD